MAKQFKPGTRLTQKIKQPRDSDHISAFFTCPKGHKLPHRTKRGRCAPFDCVDAKGGAHAAVRAVDKAVKHEAVAYAEETMALADMKDKMRAWNDAHPVPTLAPPPKTSSVREYMEKRMEQAMPLALERRIRMAVLDPGHQGEAAARELMNRGGYSERPELRADYQGPVLIVNITAGQMKEQSPYASQGKSLSPRAEVVDATFKAVGHGSDDSVAAGLVEGASVAADARVTEAGETRERAAPDEDVEPGVHPDPDGVRSPAG